jgi:hypothetical protein
MSLVGIRGDGVLYSIGLWIFCLLISIIRFLVAQIEMWLDQLDEFKQAILNRLAQPASPIEQELFNLDGHTERAQYVLHCDPEHWRIFGFLDDTNVRSCRLGSGPVGPGEGAGRP